MARFSARLMRPSRVSRVGLPSLVSHQVGQAEHAAEAVGVGVDVGDEGDAGDRGKAGQETVRPAQARRLTVPADERRVRVGAGSRHGCRVLASPSPPSWRSGTLVH